MNTGTNTPDEPQITFGGYLKYCRIMKLLTVREIAASAGLNPSCVSALEAGNRPPSLTTLRKLLAALDLPANSAEVLKHAGVSAIVQRGMALATKRRMRASAETGMGSQEFAPNDPLADFTEPMPGSLDPMLFTGLRDFGTDELEPPLPDDIIPPGYEDISPAAVEPTWGKRLTPDTSSDTRNTVPTPPAPPHYPQTGAAPKRHPRSGSKP